METGKTLTILFILVCVIFTFGCKSNSTLTIKNTDLFAAEALPKLALNTSPNQIVFDRKAQLPPNDLSKILQQDGEALIIKKGILIRTANPGFAQVKIYAISHESVMATSWWSGRRWTPGAQLRPTQTPKLQKVSFPVETNGSDLYIFIAAKGYQIALDSIEIEMQNSTTTEQRDNTLKPRQQLSKTPVFQVGDCEQYKTNKTGELVSCKTRRQTYAIWMNGAIKSLPGKDWPLLAPQGTSFVDAQQLEKCSRETIVFSPNGNHWACVEHRSGSNQLVVDGKDELINAKINSVVFSADSKNLYYKVIQNGKNEHYRRNMSDGKLSKANPDMENRIAQENLVPISENESILKTNLKTGKVIDKRLGKIAQKQWLEYEGSSGEEFDEIIFADIEKDSQQLIYYAVEQKRLYKIVDNY
ncbi:MAG: hypothetical protein OEZ58_14755 [Gammaproteobacteria bacterium]|nr:hypothetical protein [Gammaproteobacteria bacterium]